MTSSDTHQQSSPPATPHRPHRRNLAGTAGLRMLALALGFVTNIVLARMLGVNEYGVFTYILAWVGLLSAVGVFGLDRLLVRDIAVYNGQKSWGLLRGILGWSHLLSLSISIGIVALGVTLGRFGSGQLGTELVAMLPVAGAFLICIVMIRISGSALQGFHRIVSGQVGETVVQPVMGLLLIVVAGILWHWKLVAPHVLALYVVSAGLAWAINGWLLWRALPDGVRVACGQYKPQVWLMGAIPLFLISALDMFNRQTSLLVLGAFAAPDSLGVYSAADRLAQLVVFPLSVVNLTLAPTFATLYQTDNSSGLQRLVTRSARLVLLTSTPIALALIFGSHWFLLLFGSGFSGGEIPLIILCIGQLVNATMGSVGYLLIMTGHGRDAAIGIGIGAGANLLLSLSLVPLFGVDGAAMASALSLMLWNVTLAVFVWKRIRITTTAFTRIGS
jgi:O-antigen/teichoic acid export membrane protein